MKTIQSVHFPLDVVTTISRGLNSVELHQVDAFENHVGDCRKCLVASYSREFSETLCQRGRYLADNMLSRLVGAPNGHTYSTASQHTRYIRVEIPRRMIYTRLLYRGKSSKRRRRFGGGLRNSAQDGKWQAEAAGRRFTVVYRTRVAR